ncbi:hypothetical protein EPA93_10845 [Ktedonosporobacter rubrisoli]|uniref:Uncharacterized protein n=1 Tax=Ktedonosporobacter rubrisoli TaxID=2509675 RepID=A0A4P6JMJ6_KTERU|nr:hypothetical protein [Ktedonosporobacter rubrisoli]QBD76479.1 hypothetical protein EPA93_10845 [Ktedonosporobacter rubrisoli]
MATQTSGYGNNLSSPQLRRILLLDCLTSLLGALGFLAVAASPLAQLMGFNERALPLIIGIALLAYMVWLFSLTRKPAIWPGEVMAVMVINDCWVLAWLVVLIANWLSLTVWGELFVGLTVVVVALFSTVEFLYLRKGRRN